MWFGKNVSQKIWSFQQHIQVCHHHSVTKLSIVPKFYSSIVFLKFPNHLASTSVKSVSLNYYHTHVI